MLASIKGSIFSLHTGLVKSDMDMILFESTYWYE